MDEQLRKAALEYHRLPTPGKIAIAATKGLINQRDLRSRMRIPVFHDDQHGTAIIVGATLSKGLKVVGKDIGKARLVVSGAGAAALACLDILVAMNMLRLPRNTVFICEPYVNFDPSAEVIAETTMLAAEEIRRFGLTPKVALLSHSSFGAANTPTALKMRNARARIRALAPDLECEGEMQGDLALSQEIRDGVSPGSRLKGAANLLVMPNLDAANIAFNLLKQAAGDGITVGPILLGGAKPVQIMTPSATVRRLVNMTALTVADAGGQRGEQKPLL